MSYYHANVALSPGQINKLKSKQASASGTSITLKHGQLSGGQNKLSVTQTQLNQINKARPTEKGIRLAFTATAVRNMVKFGGIFPLIPILAFALTGALAAAGRDAALGAVGTAAGMALKKAMGKGYKQGGLLPLSTARPMLAAIDAGIPARMINTLSSIGRLGGPVASLLNKASKSGSGYKKKKGRSLRLPGTPASWYPKH